MKITYVAMYYPPHTGGLELVAQKQAQSAVTAGHTVSVVTFAFQKEQVGMKNEKGVQVTRVRGLHFFDRYFGIPFCIGGIGMIRALSHEIKNADIVHVHDVFYMTSWLAYLFANLYRKPLLLTQHVAMVKHTNTFVMAVQKIVYSFFGTRIFRASQKIVVYNTIVTEFLVSTMKVPKEKILEVGNGIDVGAYGQVNREEKQKVRKKIGLPVDRTIVLFVGRFVPKKGYTEMYEARDKDFDIVFVGSGVLPQEWHKEPRVHILGKRTPEELRDIYKAVDILVAPTQGELFTLVMQEAFASGLPVITTNEKEYATSNLDLNKIILCEPNPVVLRTEINKLITDEIKMRAMSRYSIELAKTRFDWGKNIHQVLNLYQTVEQEKKSVIVTTSWDDGHILDLKLAKLLSKYSLTGTFYVSPENQELSKEERLSNSEIKELSKKFEIGAHTLTHRLLIDLSLEEAQKEIFESKKYLESLVSKKVTSFCYPRGAYRKEHVRMVARAGFLYARTVERFVTKLVSTKKLETPTTVHTYDHWSDIWGVLVLARFNPITFFKLYRKWDDIAIALFDRVVHTGGVFHLWGHSWELRDHNDWNRLERVFQHISHKTGVRYVTNSETYE